MNVRLKYSIEFVAGVYFAGEMRMSNYRLNLWLLTTTMEPEEHNIALERVKYFVGSQLDSSVFINIKHKDQCLKLHDAGVNITTLPEEPVDQVVGMMLYSKLNAIMENRMVAMDIELSSDLGANVVYLHCEEESLGPLNTVGWWQEADLTHCHSDLVDNKVMSLSQNAAWRELGLAWPDSSTSEESGNTIVFADFNRDDTK